MQCYLILYRADKYGIACGKWVLRQPSIVTSLFTAYYGQISLLAIVIALVTPGVLPPSYPVQPECTIAHSS